MNWHEQIRQSMLDMLEMSDRWMHCAIVMAMIAKDHGADSAMIDGLLRASKEEIDRELLDRLGGSS